MGTRNLTCVYFNGEYKIAQYGQWDGYPSGQGLTALHFLKNADIVRFKQSLQNVSWITDGELKQRWLEFGHNIDEGGVLVSCQIASLFYRKYPELSRDTAAEILNIVYDTVSPILLSNHILFAKDSLFCEWAYVVDLDKNTFEVYQGFNESPLGNEERFKPMEDDTESDYYPVKCVATYSLDNLPTDEIFLYELEGETEE
jgi:hypothetical protein